ncbi:MAG TPA: ribonuclease D [Candidatus Desulfofervidus auxilii]|uniref:Ribonuclease D n=1 Tax=Desulfofervidus auxilii TaxID=1621989 RepID=A0A7C0U3W4_DESA2|nr:ribonuclease D [Candidatus Desulfofervidus auxilii]
MTYQIYYHDISNKYLDQVYKTKIVAWDIETSGLDWRNDQIGLCQLYTPGQHVAVVKINNVPPKKLCLLLRDVSIKKVFHHAMFDLRFMSYRWKVLPQNIACTKIAAKLLDAKNENKHSLQVILKQYLGVIIDKKEQLSNWLSPELTKEQISYAVNDVIYLLPLLDVLEKNLKSKGLLELAHLCFAFIPTRVQLEILGYKDIYSY